MASRGFDQSHRPAVSGDDPTQEWHREQIGAIVVLRANAPGSEVILAPFDVERMIVGPPAETGSPPFRPVSERHSIN